MEDTYTKVLSFPLLSFQRKELEGPESSWKAAHLTLSNFFFLPQTKSTHQTLREISSVPSLISPPFP